MSTPTVVRKILPDPANSDSTCDLGTEDDPAFVGMHESLALIAG